MIKPVAINKDAEQFPSLNFEFLRSAGIALIQQMAGKRWTDFNLHDPGITILEQLCYAITDLAYRTDFPIQDLLANEKGVIDYEKNSFFRKEDILTTNPITINDYRKVIIDEVNEVENVWLYPVSSVHSKRSLKGLYKIVVQVKSEVAEQLISESQTDERIAALVRECFTSRRNLCEDIIEDIIILKPIKITVEADVQVTAQITPEEVLAAIYHQLENSLNLPVRYFAEKEMLEKGYRIDEIYSGPFLKKGFIPDSELNDRKTLIDPTELIKTISQVTGVLSVKKLKIVNGSNSRQNKPYKIDEFSFPLLDIRSSEQHIRLYKDNFELTIKRPLFRALLQKIREAGDRSFISSFYNTSGNGRIKGKYHNNEHYYSIQDQFPRIYGIGREGLTAGVSDRRKAQAKQLKGYLLLFEQVMANYLSQLANINEVFSPAINKKGRNTYYTNPLYQVPDVKALLKAFTSGSQDLSEDDWEAFKKDKGNNYVKAINQAGETDQTYIERKNRLIDHLFARFNEFVTPYPVQLYAALYEPYNADERAGTELKWKSELIKNISWLGQGRVRAFNYLESDKQESTFDFARKMRMLLYINDANHDKQLTSVFNPDHITITQEEKRGTQADATEPEDTDELSWQGDMPRILIDKKEVAKLMKSGRIEHADDIPRDASVLRNQDVSVLKHALDIKNFRIGADPAAGYLLLYKGPSDDIWKTISRFTNHSAAMKALNHLISYIRTINIQSEGFYILEHILLRPDLDSEVFGFRYIAGDGRNLMEHSKWMSFQKREEVVASLLKVFADKNEITAERLAPLCKVNLYYPASEAAETYKNNRQDIREEKNAFNYFKAFAVQQGKFLSGLEMIVKGDNNEVVNEDFFNLRMSVVFPSWPARFQDKNFREATENLFRLNLPAQVRANFIWMNVTRLKKFEALYFDWKRFMREANNTGEVKSELRNALILMLNRYIG